ncbi:MAG: sugar ABC transporter ATP-binding protein [Lachnospiraceae bacterium]
MEEKIIGLKHVNKHYGGVHALKDVDFDLNRGEIHCLIGQNGCGKSTMIKVISGVIDVDEGSEVILDGKKCRGGSARQAMNNGVRVIYQDLSLFPNLTVAENIAFDRHEDKSIKGVSWPQIFKQAEEVLDRMDIKLELESLVEELSIADRQLVAIARALATNARILIMDEPTSSLTRKEVNVLFSIIKSLQEKGMTIMFVSHKLDEIIEIAERITVMRDGKIISTFENKDVDETNLAHMISGQEISYQQQFTACGDEVILEVEGLTCGRQYKDISFSLKKGEILGIIGLLGAGRTELASSIFGMNEPESGRILLHGEEVHFRSNRDAIAKRIAYVPEDRLLQGLVLNQSIENNTIISIIGKLKNRLGLIDKKGARSITRKWIDELHIKSAVPEINASAMSGGNQQKIVISKWLSTEPEILILDQPTNGIDIAAKNTIYELIRELAKKGMSIIMISDEAAEIYYNCPRALVMHKGKIVKELNTSTITEGEFGREVLDE